MRGRFGGIVAQQLLGLAKIRLNGDDHGKLHGVVSLDQAEQGRRHHRELIGIGGQGHPDRLDKRQHVRNIQLLECIKGQRCGGRARANRSGSGRIVSRLKPPVRNPHQQDGTFDRRRGSGSLERLGRHRGFRQPRGCRRQRLAVADHAVAARDHGVAHIEHLVG